MVCGKRKWLFLGSLTQLENTGEVLGTEPFLWLLSPIIALGCVTDVQHTYSQKRKKFPLRISAWLGAFQQDHPFHFSVSLVLKLGTAELQPAGVVQVS